MSKEATFTLTVGRLLCRRVRDFLRECEFKGMKIKWIESSGWIERDFIIKGSLDSIIAIEQIFDKWIIEMKREEKK